MSGRASWAWLSCRMGQGSIWRTILGGSYGEVDGSAVRGRGSAIRRGREAGQWGTVRIVLR